MTIHEKLSLLQQEYKAPKDQYNAHGKFKFRNIEGMLEALKPLLAKHKVALKFSDTLAEAGGIAHIVVECMLIDLESKDTVVTRSVAQEAETQKGMQAAQISGSTSSYARKYALNGLLLVDDSQELDAKEGDQTDWQGEIDRAKTVGALMNIFNRMDPSTKTQFTESLSTKKSELIDEDL